MLITDGQVHIWAADTPERPWPGRKPNQPIGEPLGAAEIVAEMDSAGVDRVVLIPPFWDGNRSDLALAAVADYPGRFGIVSHIELDQPRSLAHFKDQPGMLGVRGLFIFPEQRAALRDGSSEWLFATAEEAGIPMMLCVPGQIELVGPYAERHPSLRLIIDHLGLDNSVQGADTVSQAIEPLFKLADLPNVAVKVSSLPCYVSDPYPFPSLHPIIARVVATFGADRCMWGSDLSRLNCSYGEWRRAITDEADYLSAREKDLLMGESLANWLDWPED